MPTTNRETLGTISITLTKQLLLAYVGSIIGVAVVFFLKRNDLRESLRGTALNNAFQYDVGLFYAIVSTMAVTVTIALELILDYTLQWSSGIDDNNERIFMVLNNVIPGILLLIFRLSPDVSFVFCAVHSVQYVGCLLVILSLCNKLVPRYFPPLSILFVSILFSLAAIFSMLAVGTPLTSWSNIFTFFFGRSFPRISIYLGVHMDCLTRKINRSL